MLLLFSLLLAPLDGVELALRLSERPIEVADGGWFKAEKMRAGSSPMRCVSPTSSLNLSSWFGDVPILCHEAHSWIA
jgi:hypothetical protein